MSHSVPSESSALDTTFVMGVELVEFDRRDLPIYLKLQAPLAEACVDEATYGAPVDRVFGEPGNVHIDSGAFAAEDWHAADTPPIVDDPMIMLGDLSDGLIISATDPSDVRQFGAIFDFGADTNAVVHLDDGGGWNTTDGTFDFIT